MQGAWKLRSFFKFWIRKIHCYCDRTRPLCLGSAKANSVDGGPALVVSSSHKYLLVMRKTIVSHGGNQIKFNCEVCLLWRSATFVFPSSQLIGGSRVRKAMARFQSTASARWVVTKLCYWRMHYCGVDSTLTQLHETITLWLSPQSIEIVLGDTRVEHGYLRDSARTSIRNFYVRKLRGALICNIML